jgi:hypothetical protein
MIKYIAWPILVDSDFRSRYLEVTNERIQPNPLINVEETYYMVGTSRATEQNLTLLQSEFPDLLVGNAPLWSLKPETQL